MRGKYRRLFSSSARPKKPGPKGPSESLIRAIVELKSRNPRFGCPRIARIISQTFGVDIDKNVVHRVLAKPLSSRPGRNRALVVVVRRTHDRQSVERGPLALCVHRAPERLGARGHGPVHAAPRGIRCASRTGSRHPASAACATPAIQGRGAPRHLSTDHDPLFEAHRWTANLRLLEIDEIKTVPHVPLSHPFVERLIGTMRRECLDHVLFWNAGDLERKLADFQAYYNAARSHASLEGYTPLGFAGERTAARAEFNHVRWISHCRGMVQLPAAA